MATPGPAGRASDLADDPEADARVGRGGRAAQAPGRACLRRRVGPRATTHHLVPAAGIDPRPTVGGGAPVAVVPAVGDPLADVAGDVVKAECIGCVAAHRRRAPGIVGIPVEGIAPFAPARRAVPAAGEVATARRRRPLAPRIGRLAAGAEHVLELRLAWQPVVASGLFG